MLAYGAESDRVLGIPGEVRVPYLMLKRLAFFNKYITENSIDLHLMFNSFYHLMKKFSNGFFYSSLYIFQVLLCALQGFEWDILS